MSSKKDRHWILAITGTAYSEEDSEELQKTLIHERNPKTYSNFTSVRRKKVDARAFRISIFSWHGTITRTTSVHVNDSTSSRGQGKQNERLVEGQSPSPRSPHTLTGEIVQ